MTKGIAQNNSLSGYVLDAETGEALIAANIFIEELGTGTTTNEYGYYTIAIAAQKLKCTFSYIGYTNKILVLSLIKDTVVNVMLKNSLQLEEVVVKGTKNNTKFAGGKVSVPIQLLTKIPIIGGENDLLKSLSLFPGISTGQEGSSSLYVRGGTPDQNLILLDGIPVYNATHLGGFFSVFNTNALNNVEVLKGNFPARYGGRLSSVIDITMKEGNNKKFEGRMGVGILTSHLALEGPIKKEKSSFLFTARTSYLGLINSFKKKENAENYFDYWLYDINAKVNFKLKKGKLFFSAYTGNDFGINYSNTASSISGNRVLAFAKDESKVVWGNTIISSRYIVPISSKVFGKFLVGFSQYRYKFSSESVEQIFLATDTLVNQTAYQNLSLVNDFIIQTNFDHALSSKHFLKYGLGLTFHQFATGVSEGINNSIDKKLFKSKELYTYIEDEIQLTPQLSTNIGFRWSALSSDGKTYAQFEPRFSLQWQLNPTLLLNSSYSTNQQYIHLLPSGSFGFPNDIWVPTTKNTAPQKAAQLSLGAQVNFQNGIQLSIDSYFKKMSNLIEYKIGIEDINTKIDDWENLIERNGQGESYGIEWLLEKKNGKLSGFLSYTLSWNYRQFEAFNFTQKYPFTYDRRHDLAIVLHYRFSNKWMLSSNWIFQTGRAITLPVGAFPNPKNQGFTPIFVGKNNGRLLNYHRLDIGVKRKKITKKNNTLTWKLSVYNAYNRPNPSFLRVRADPILDDESQLLYFKVSVEQTSLFTIIPALNMEYKF